MNAALVSEQRLGRQSSVVPFGESPRRGLYKENVFPSTLYQSISSLSSSLSIPIFQQIQKQINESCYSSSPKLSSLLEGTLRGRLSASSHNLFSNRVDGAEYLDSGRHTNGSYPFVRPALPPLGWASRSVWVRWARDAVGVLVRDRASVRKWVPHQRTD